MEQKQQNQQEQGGQTFHAPNTGWAADYGTAGASRPAAKDEQALQQELEKQLRAFGVSVSDGFRFGFEGRGEELGDRARDLGSAFLDVVNYGIGQSRQAVEEARAHRQDGRQGQAGYRPGRKNALNKFAGTRLGVGLAQTITGGIFLFSLGLGGLICTGLGITNAAGLDSPVVLIVGVSLLAACLPFLWLTLRGVQNLKARGRLKAYGSVVGTREEVSIEELAQADQRYPRDTVKDLRKMLRRGWLVGWLDEESGMLYLTERAYAAGQERKELAAREAAAAKKAEEAEKAADAQAARSATLSSMENFLSVLGQEQALAAGDMDMAEQLAQMEKSSRAILNWLKGHPESLPKARRLASYYIPTTLKLLHTYNDVKGQTGENAQNIRHEIVGMMHTLNLAFSNLHDNLLSDVALDVSSEIAALQGMLARDGLSEDPILDRK